MTYRSCRVIATVRYRAHSRVHERVIPERRKASISHSRKHEVSLVAKERRRWNNKERKGVFRGFTFERARAKKLLNGTVRETMGQAKHRNRNLRFPPWDGVINYEIFSVKFCGTTTAARCPFSIFVVPEESQGEIIARRPQNLRPRHDCNGGLASSSLFGRVGAPRERRSRTWLLFWVVRSILGEKEA